MTTTAMDTGMAKAGQEPATAVYVGPERDRPVNIHVVDYDANSLAEHDGASFETCEAASGTPENTWINVDGIHDAELVAELGKRLDVHPLVVEDILDVGQRPKMDSAGDYIYLVLKSLLWDDEAKTVRAEQVSLVIGPCFLLSFEEEPSELFHDAYHRLRGGRARLREQGTDFLAHALMDAIVDRYFMVLEKLADHIEVVQDEVLATPGQDDLSRIHELKRTLAYVRGTVWPLREAINGVTRADPPIISDKLQPYLRDVYDNTIQVIDNVEVQREVVSGMLDLYLSSVSNRTNEVMKVLTIISSIFVPLTFVAGVYGMNFEYMPELTKRWGYPVVMLFMAVVAAMEIRWFRRKGWF